MRIIRTAGAPAATVAQTHQEAVAQLRTPEEHPAPAAAVPTTAPAPPPTAPAATALATLDSWAIRSEDAIAALADIGSEINVYDLEEVKVPAGGVTLWTVNTDKGEENLKEFQGVIISKQDQRVLWAGAYTGTAEDPLCSSKDGIEGTGDPGGNCATCPNSKFGPESQPPRCKLSAHLAIISQDSVLPRILKVPPSSLQNLRKYMISLAARAVGYTSCITSFSLKKEKSGSGIVYSQIEFKMAARLTPEDKGRMAETIQSLSTLLRKQG